MTRARGHLPRLWCAACGNQVRVTEPFAFGGRDRLRSGLACGHVVERHNANA